jgi:hypothetical protein
MTGPRGRHLSAHRIDLSPAEPPAGVSAHCTCGGWARSYRTHDEWSSALDDARGHVASLSGSYQQEDDGHVGGITVRGQRQVRRVVERRDARPASLST